MTRTTNQVFNDILVMLAQEGDREALEKLARRWWPRHHTHARRLLGQHEGAADKAILIRMKHQGKKRGKHD